MVNHTKADLIPQNLPPLSNRGVTENFKGKLCAKIDWLRYSVGWPNGSIPAENILTLLQAAVLPSPLTRLTGETLPNAQGYNMGYKMKKGGSIRYHSENPKQKIGVELTGVSLTNTDDDDVLPVFEVIKYALDNGAKFTRIDLALDIFDCDADPLDLDIAWKQGALRTNARTVSLRQDSKLGDNGLELGGATVYVGSRTSDKFLRVYDKAKERGLDGKKWTRIELQLGGDVAAAYAHILTEQSLPELTQTAIKAFCDAPTVDWYTHAVTGATVALPVLPRTTSDTFLWLLEQVLPAFQRELAESAEAGDWRLYNAYSRALRPYTGALRIHDPDKAKNIYNGGWRNLINSADPKKLG